MIVFNAERKVYELGCEGCGQILAHFDNEVTLRESYETAMELLEILEDMNFVFKKHYCARCKMKLIGTWKVGDSVRVKVVHYGYEAIGIRPGDVMTCEVRRNGEFRYLHFNNMVIDLKRRTYRLFERGMRVDGVVMTLERTEE